MKEAGDWANQTKAKKTDPILTAKYDDVICAGTRLAIDQWVIDPDRVDCTSLTSSLISRFKEKTQSAACHDWLGEVILISCRELASVTCYKPLLNEMKDGLIIKLMYKYNCYLCAT